jgi:FixJ family two-component response regulator
MTNTLLDSSHGGFSMKHAQQAASPQSDRKTFTVAADLTILEKRLSRLTPQEREAFFLIVTGLLDQEAATILGISDRSFQKLREQVMQKMGAPTFAKLVGIAVRLRDPRLFQ